MSQHPSQTSSPLEQPHTPDPAKTVGHIETLEEQILMLQSEVVKRGVKLNCANIALSRAKIAFEQAAVRRDELVMEVSHDLKTPLTAIVGAAENVLDGIVGPVEGDVFEYIEMIRDQALRLGRAVDWLVDNLRMAATPVELSQEPIDLAALVTQTVRALEPIAADGEIGLTLSISDQVSAICDHQKIVHVCQNIVGNALKFTDSGGRVTVELGRFGDHARLVVRDTGIGMKEDELEQIFDRFYRAPTDRDGTGLGLSISREFVRLHGGDICACSEPGVGSEFTIRIPLDPG